jgi:O-6-methylguanine DNA methyltransferase
MHSMPMRKSDNVSICRRYSESPFTFSIMWRSRDGLPPRICRIELFSFAEAGSLPAVECPEPIPDPEIERLASDIRRYLRGERGVKLSVELCDLSGMPVFQQKVLHCLRNTVPSGCRITYAELARRAGYPGAARAVGTAMRKNPFPLLFPCHRVVRSDGTLGRYSPEPSMKRLLLELEQNTDCR